MPISDLKKLKEKENFIFLILIIWLIVGFTVIQFEELLISGITRIIFYPLLIVCIVLVLYSFVFRGELTKLTWKNVLKACGLFAIIGLVYYLLGEFLFNVLIRNFTSLMFVISIFSLVFITAIFAMYFCYEKGIKLDEAFYKAREPFGFILRWTLFIGGVLFSLFIILFVPSFAAGQPMLIPREDASPEVAFMVGIIPLITIFVILGLVVVALVFVLIKGRLNAWLGLFFVFTTIYISFLMVNALLTLEQGGAAMPLLMARVALYIFDLFILLITISSLVGKKAEILSEKLKFVKSDAILVWLIFSKAAYEYSDALLTSAEVSELKSIGVFFLFIPLMIIMALAGIIMYGKLKRERKRVKKGKKLLRKERKEWKKQEKAKAKKSG